MRNKQNKQKGAKQNTGAKSGSRVSMQKRSDSARSSKHSTQPSPNRYPTEWGATPLRDVFDRLYEQMLAEPIDFLRTPRLLSYMNRAYFPHADVRETGDTIEVRADIPGVAPEKLEVYVRNDGLHIAGNIEQKHELTEPSEETNRAYRFERMHGTFHRVLSLPAEVDKDAVRAVCMNGVLTVTLPKIQGSHARIPIEVDDSTEQKSLVNKNNQKT